MASTAITSTAEVVADADHFSRRDGGIKGLLRGMSRTDARLWQVEDSSSDALQWSRRALAHAVTSKYRKHADFGSGLVVIDLAVNGGFHEKSFNSVLYTVCSVKRCRLGALRAFRGGKPKTGM